MPKHIIIFFGPPGSGKGTQADLLSQKTGWKKISTGDLLRTEVAAETKLGKLADKYLKAGKLVPDKLLIDLVAKSLRKKFSGYILDGYPRNLKQRNDLFAIFKKIIKKNDAIYAIEVAVSDKEVKQRLGKRRTCSCGAVYHLKYNPPINDGVCDVCGGKLFIRNDDKPEVISRRLKVYHEASRAVLGYWQEQDSSRQLRSGRGAVALRGKLIKINGEQPIKKIHEEIVERLKERGVV